MIIEVNQKRYDELLQKEAMLETILKLHKRTTGYSFHDVVGYLITVAESVTDEQSH